MAKASASGLTKTRLSPPLTPGEAATFNTAFLRDVADNLLAVGRTRPVAGYMAFGPTGARPFFDALLPPGIEAFECWQPDFGACLQHALAEQFGRGHRAACVLNADSPNLPLSFLNEAVDILAEPGERAVMGPSADGGYYLLGLKRPNPRLFDDIAWSTDAVASQTLERAREIGLPIHVLPTWYDVDDAASLRMLVADLDASGDRCPATRELVTEFRSRGLDARLHPGLRIVDRCHSELPEASR